MTETQTSYHRFLIKHRVYCEHETYWNFCYQLGTTVEKVNGRDTVLCHEHASRLANVRKSEKAFELKEAKTRNT